MGATIKSLEKISAEDSTDKLILRFDDAKFSVIRYIPKIGDFVTVSMHCFDQIDRLLENDGYNPCKSTAVGIWRGDRTVCVSPDGRCALARIDTGNWAVIPLSKDETGDGEGESKILSSKIIDERLLNVLDFCFLDGFYEPTVAFITESVPNWPSLNAVKKETIDVLVATLNVSTGTFTPIFQKSGFSAECRRLFPVAKPIGGMILHGANIFVHLDLAGNTCILPLNNFAREYWPAARSSKCPLSLLSSGALCMAGEMSAIWASIEGKWFWLKLVRGPRGVASMNVEEFRLEGLNSPLSLSSLKQADSYYVFSASASGGTHQLVKIPSANSNGDATMTDDLYGGTEEDDLYGSSEIKSTDEEKKVSTELMGEIPCIGPIASSCLGPRSRHNSDIFDLVAVGGNQSTNEGHATIISRSLPLIEMTGFDLEGAIDVFVLQPSYLVVSTETSSMLLSIGSERMEEVEDTSFDLTSPTIMAAVSSSTGNIIQAARTSIRILSPDTLMTLQEVDVNLSYAASCRDFLAVITVQSICQLFRIKNSGELEEINSFEGVKHVSLVESSGQIIISILSTSGHVKICSMEELIFESDCLPFLSQTVISGKSFNQHDKEMYLKAVYLLEGLSSLFVVVCTGHLVTVYRLDGGIMTKVLTELSSDTMFRPFQDFTEGSKGLIGTEMMILLGSLGYPRVHRLPSNIGRADVLESRKVVAVREGRVSVMKIPVSTCLDSQLPFTRHVFEHPILTVTYNSSAHCYGVIMSKKTVFSLPDDDYSQIADNKEWRPSPPLESTDFPNPIGTHPQFALLWPDDETGSLTVSDRYDLEADERVVGCQMMTLSTKEVQAGKKPFMVVGAVKVLGEDRPVRSRVLIFDTQQVIPEPGQPPSTGLRAKLLCSHPLKTTISALSPLAGHLSITSGYKTILYEFEDNETLTGVAFVDSGVHQPAASTVKNFLWLGDAGGRGVGIYGFQERPGKLVELGRSVDPDEVREPVMAMETVVSSSGQMSAVTVNDTGRLSFHSYTPTSLSTMGGTRLVHLGVFNLGNTVTRMNRLVSGSGISILWSSIEGALGIITPLDDDTFRLLFDLQTRLTTELPHPAGIHPKAGRGTPPHRQMIDMSLVGRFVGLPRLAQKRLSSDPAKCLEAIDSIYRDTKF